jgi:Na+/melibiose symporter-like transporter
MTNVPANHRGVFSGMLSLSRNLGLIIGASAMGALFAYAAGTSEVSAASPAAVAAGLRLAFGIVASLLAAALAVAVGAGRLADRRNADGRPIASRP